MTNILITGAGGFVGTYLIKELQAKGAGEIYGGVYNSSIELENSLPKSQILEGDLTDFAFAKTLIKWSQPDVIYHLAALSVVGTSQSQALSVLQSNTAISYNLLEAVRLHAQSARVLAICSANAYGAVIDSTHPLDEHTPLRPLNAYAVSKVTQEMLALEYHLAHGLDVVILRPFNHTGPGQTTDFVIPSLAKQFVELEKSGQPGTIYLGNTSSIRDFTDVRDMVKAYVMAAEVGVSGEIYNIGSGFGHTISQILEILQSLSSAKVSFKAKPELQRLADVPFLVADATKFKSETLWSPSISLNTTISDILNYYRGKVT